MLLTILGIVAVGTVLCAWRWLAWGRFYTVDPGRLYRSGEMPLDRLISTCLSYGIRTVVDFRKSGELAAAERAALASAGVRHVHLPSNQVPTPETVLAFLQIMDDPRNHPVLVHCTHGVGRTGLIAAVYRIEYQGWPNERARSEAALLAGFESFGRDTDKGRFLLGYVSRRHRPPER